MKTLHFVEKHRYIGRSNETIHCRVFKHEKLPNHVLVEVTKEYETWNHRTWYCPEVSTWKGVKKITSRRKPDIWEDNLGGCAGLSYWFNIHGLSKKSLDTQQNIGYYGVVSDDNPFLLESS